MLSRGSAWHSWVAGIACLLLLAGSAHAESIIDQVTKRGTLRIAAEGQFPFGRMTPSGELEGYDYEVGKALAAALHVKPEFIIIDTPGRVTALQTRKADVTIAEFTRTVERSMVVAFSEPYTVSYPLFLVKANRDDIKTTADLNKPGIKISFGRGGTAEQDVPAMAPTAQYLRIGSGADDLRAVTSGQSDAAGEDNFFIGAAIKDHPGEFKSLPSVNRKSDICIGLPAGDPDWLRVINVWVKQFNTSGENARLFKAWFGFDPPKIQQDF